MDSLGYNAYTMTNFLSTFDPKTLEVEVEFNENQSEIDLLKMEREFEFEDDSGDADVPEGHQTVVIEMADARTLELFNKGKGDSMVAGSGASRRTGYEESVGAQQ